MNTPIPTERPADHFREALAKAVRSGNDADTVAFVAGALLDAIWGTGAAPVDWLGQIHGWRGLHSTTPITLIITTYNFNDNNWDQPRNFSRTSISL